MTRVYSTQQLEFDAICALIEQRCVSPAGKQRAREAAPLGTLGAAQRELETVEALRAMIVANNAPGISAVDAIADIAARSKKGGIISMGELLSVRAALANARILRSWCAGKETVNAADALFYPLYEDAGFEREIGDCILSESEMSDDASSELKSIRKRIAQAEDSIRDKLDSILRSSETSKYLQDAVVTIRGGRFVVPVKTEHKGAIDGLIHDVSSSGSTQFIEPAAVVEANNRIMQLKSEEMREIDRILQAFTQRVADIADQLTESYNAYVEIDYVLARARYAAANDCVLPALNQDGVVDIKKGRHPLIDPKLVVPIDVSLGRDYRVLVITGPNTGGKTVTLKTVGLFVLMAMSGMLVPAARGTELAFFEQVLVDIGDEQSIQQSLSTFSGHMKNIAGILKQAGPDSLVLLDELGAGTDPAEGAALAVAILERLRGYGSRVLATTHYGEIKLYAMKTEAVQNASSEFDAKTLQPIYKVTIGLPGRSNALLIGERLGLDAALLDAARKNMSSDTLYFEDALGEIEQLKSEIARQREQAEEKVRQSEDIVAEAEKEKQRLLSQAQNELENAKRKAKQLSADVSAGAYKLLDEIKALESQSRQDSRAAAQRARQIANKDSQALFDMAPDTDVMTEDLEPATDFSVGAAVFVPSLGQTAEVVSPPDKNGLVELKAGSLKTRADIATLKKPPKTDQKQKKPRPKGGGQASAAPQKRSAQTEINLLGLTVEEAILEVERFIDNAVLSHLSTVYLIHGKGTGALRGGIQNHLKRLKHVKSFRLGGFGEGEDGVTIVELK